MTFLNTTYTPLKPLLGLALAIMAIGCNVTRKIPEGERLLTGYKFDVKDSTAGKKDKKKITSLVEDLPRPKPNASILGVRYKLWFYQNTKEPKKPGKGIRNFFKYKLGEPPVYVSQVNIPRNSLLLQNKLENTGYYKAFVNADTVTKGKMASVDFRINAGQQYTINEVFFPIDQTDLALTIRGTKEKTILRPGDPYVLDNILRERERIDKALKDSGYYYFNPNYLLARIDSTVAGNKVNIFMTIKPETPYLARRKFYINDIYIYPNYSLEMDTVKMAQRFRTRTEGLYIVDPEKMFKKSMFRNLVQFQRKDHYNRAAHNASLNRMINIGTFKFVKNRFEEIKANPGDSQKLNVYYYLTPLPKKSLRGEFTVKTNSANFNGGQITGSWRNRNTFRGAELLTLSLIAGSEVQVSGQNSGYNIFRLGTEASLTWPRIVPAVFKRRIIRADRAYIPRTRALVGVEFQNRQRLYTLLSGRAQYGFLWKKNVYQEHQLNPINITYVQSANITDEYLQQIAANPVLARVTERQFIFGPSYNYLYTNTMEQARRGNVYFNGNLELSAPVTGLLQGANAKTGDSMRIFNVRYSQYVRAEGDFRYYRRLGSSAINQLVGRLFIGAGLPYGNSTEMPFIKQFFSGGTNSIRAFRARSLGPGSYAAPPTATGFLPDLSGDIKLELNLEYRFKIFSVLRGALFADAGNVWLWNDNPNKPGGKFSGQFLNQMAVGVGAGLRVDANIIVLRLDVGVPVRDPRLPAGQRFVLDQFGARTLVYNLAVGYPF